MRTVNLAGRMLRAARLDAGLYSEVKADEGAMGQAALVVVISSVAAGLGSFGRGGAAILVGTAMALLGWFIWSLLVFVIGAKVLPEPQTASSFPALLRAAGFATAPGAIRVFGLLPGIAGLVFLIAALWMIAAMIIAVRQALGYKSTWRAAAVSMLGWILQVLVTGALMYASGI